MAGYERPRTTKLYDQTKERLTLDEAERIRPSGAERHGRPCVGLRLTLDKAHALPGMAALGGKACAEVRTLAAAHLADVRARIANLRSIERIHAQAVRQCDAAQRATRPLERDSFRLKPSRSDFVV
jgi:hypothetical protein